MTKVLDFSIGNAGNIGRLVQWHLAKQSFVLGFENYLKQKITTKMKRTNIRTSCTTMRQKMRQKISISEHSQQVHEPTKLLCSCIFSCLSKHIAWMETNQLSANKEKKMYLWQISQFPSFIEVNGSIWIADNALIAVQTNSIVWKVAGHVKQISRPDQVNQASAVKWPMYNRQKQH